MGVSIDHPDHHAVRVLIPFEHHLILVPEHIRTIQSFDRLNDFSILRRLRNRDLRCHGNGSIHAAIHCRDIHNASFGDGRAPLWLFPPDRSHKYAYRSALRNL
jgi:hypothetical protein